MYDTYAGANSSFKSKSNKVLIVADNCPNFLGKFLHLSLVTVGLSRYQALLHINFDNSYPIQVPFQGNTVILLFNDTTFGASIPCQFNSGLFCGQLKLCPKWFFWNQRVSSIFQPPLDTCSKFITGHHLTLWPEWWVGNRRCSSSCLYIVAKSSYNHRQERDKDW